MKSMSQAAVKIITGQELGLSAMESMKGIHVYDGNIELHATTMKALIKRSGRYRATSKDGWVTAEGCKLLFEELVNGDWSPCDGAGLVSFTMEDAKRAGLAGKDVWKKYPEDMCYSRCLSRGFRRYCPELTGGPVYIAGEVDGERSPLDTPIEVMPTEPNTSPGEPAEAPTLTIAPKAPVTPVEVPGTTDLDKVEVVEESIGSGDTAASEDIWQTHSGNANSFTNVDLQETKALLQPAEADKPGKEHPYGRFCDKAGLIKDQIAALDGNTELYYKILGIHGFENKGQVVKSDTETMRYIILDLMDGVREAQAKKANLAAAVLEGDVIEEEAAGHLEPVA
jgi:hypothetical protein